MLAETCPYCGIQTEKADGPVHSYLKSTPGCWRKYGEILAREYENVRFFKCHSLTVDAYALQHPGEEGIQTINSANIHLASLYAYFVTKTSLSELSRIKQLVAKKKMNFCWMEPPSNMNEMNISGLELIDKPDDYCLQVEKWANFVFKKWGKHHEAAKSHLENIR